MDNLNGPSGPVKKLLLTASGGPFREWTKDQLRQVTVEDSLNHPTWNMCPKITVDSSTLMNKGLEIIEAHELFGIGYEHIDVQLDPTNIDQDELNIAHHHFEKLIGQKWKVSKWFDNASEAGLITFG